MAKRATKKRALSVAEQYIEDVDQGRIVASELVKLQIRNHLEDLEVGAERDLYFSRDAAQRVIDFFRLWLSHTQGEWDGQPFVLEPFQQAQLWILYGWKRRSTGYRRFQFAYNEQGRGNGKSALASGLCLYELIGFGEPGAEVYSASTDKKTAKLVFDTAALMVRRSPALRRRVECHTNNIFIPGTASKFEPCASDDSNLLGLRPSFVCLDELHAHKNSGVWDVMVSAMGKRRNPLLFAITNSGYDRYSICWRQREYSVKVLQKIIKDDSWFAWISGLDEGDNWEDERLWIKANPALGVIVNIEELRRAAAKAKADPSALNSFLRLRLSVWTSQLSAWMPTHVWDACAGDVDRQELRGRACYGGLDLSTTTDVSAFVLLFPPTEDDPMWRVLPRFYLPADSMEKRVKRDRVPYDVWARDGLIAITEGNVIDYDAIRLEVQELGREFDIQEIAFDRWNAQQICTQLAGDGFTMVDIGQGFASMTAPTKRLMELALEGSLAHGGNAVLRWMASNVMVKQDPAGNIKPDKGNSKEKIDGIVALIMALGRGIASPEVQYTSTEVLVA